MTSWTLVYMIDPELYDWEAEGEAPLLSDKQFMKIAMSQKHGVFTPAEFQKAFNEGDYSNCFIRFIEPKDASKYALEMLKAVDYQMLATQKQTLVDLANKQDLPGVATDLDGIISLLDSITDFGTDYLHKG